MATFWTYTLCVKSLKEFSLVFKYMLGCFSDQWIKRNLKKTTQRYEEWAKKWDTNDPRNGNKVIRCLVISIAHSNILKHWLGVLQWYFQALCERYLWKELCRVYISIPCGFKMYQNLLTYVRETLFRTIKVNINKHIISGKKWSNLDIVIEN